MRATVRMVAGLFLIGSLAFGELKTFTGATSNDWHTGSNWREPGVPDSDDDVIIPPTLTCVISSAVADARTIDIGAAAEVQIDSQDLQLHATSTGEFHLRILGRLEFKKSGASIPRLLYEIAPSPGFALIAGTGVMDAGVANGLGPAVITNIAGTTGDLLFVSGAAAERLQV